MGQLKKSETDEGIPGWQWVDGPGFMDIQGNEFALDSIVFVGVEGRRFATEYGEAITRCEELRKLGIMKHKRILTMRRLEKLADIQKRTLELSPYCFHCALPMWFEFSGTYLKDARKLYRVEVCKCESEESPDAMYRCGDCFDRLELYNTVSDPSELLVAACATCNKEDSVHLQARDRTRQFHQQDESFVTWVDKNGLQEIVWSTISWRPFLDGSGNDLL